MFDFKVDYFFNSLFVIGIEYVYEVHSFRFF